MKEKKVKATEVTQEQIEKWKKVYTVHQIDCGGKTIYVRTPTRYDIGAASVAAGGDSMVHSTAILEAIFLGGDAELVDNDEYFLGVAPQMAELIVIKEATIKKL